MPRNHVARFVIQRGIGASVRLGMTSRTSGDMMPDLMPVSCDYCGGDASVYLTQPYVFLCSKHARELAERGTLTVDVLPPLNVAVEMLATLQVSCPICREYFPIEGPGNVFWHIEWMHDGTATAQMIHDARREVQTRNEQGA